MTHPSVQRTAYPQNSYYSETLPQPATSSPSSRPPQPLSQSAQALPGTFPTNRNAYNPQPPPQLPSEQQSLPHFHPPPTAQTILQPTSPPLTPFPQDMNGSATRTRPDVANGLLKKEMYEYKAPWSVYGLDWSKRPGEKAFRLALGSFIESFSNKVRLFT